MLAVSVVAPVVAVLLEHTEFNSDEWSSGDIKDLEELIRGLVQEVQELFDPFSDDDESPQDASERDNYGRTPSVVQPFGGKRRHEATLTLEEGDPSRNRNQRRRCALDNAALALIIEKLSDDPELLERFLSIRKESSTKISAKEQNDQVRTVHETAGAPYTRKKTTVTSKYAFLPSEEQVLVHDRVTLAKHKGKSANVFCKIMARSEYAKFKALPGVCTRAYDNWFGSGGLSAHHFARLSREDRMVWLETGGSNFDNLSASPEFTAALPATTIVDVVDAVRVFLAYSSELCCLELIELVEEIIKFLEETIKQVSWSSKELSSLVYWVNDVLEEFWNATEADGDLYAVRQRCSTEDRLLRDLMFVKLHRQVDTMRLEETAGSARRNVQRDPEPQRSASSTDDGKKNLGRTPKFVLRQLPVNVESGSG
ncbi:hypothetical protein GQ600_15582 [Phytophthora cactorum]|nr:hypothetical protein GQ600_15582 [Phytophthora cactorum]